MIAGYEKRSQSLKVKEAGRMEGATDGWQEDGSNMLKEKEENMFALETYKLMHAYEKDATPKVCRAPVLGLGRV